MTTSLRMDPTIESRYENLAKSTGRTKSFYMNEALADSIDRLEWEFGILQDLEEIRQGKQKPVPLKDVMAEYGL